MNNNILFDVKEDNNNLIFSIVKENVSMFNTNLNFNEIKHYFNGFYTDIIFDLKKLKKSDSSFIALLINASNTMQIYNNKLTIRNIPSNLKRTLEICGILEFFKIS
jgi:anti-anti-sigma regulatory factor